MYNFGRLLDSHKILFFTCVDEYRSWLKSNKGNILCIFCHQKFVLSGENKMRGRKMLVCMWISFITLEIHSFPYCCPG